MRIFLSLLLAIVAPTSGVAHAADPAAFGAVPAPPAPDYAQPASWAARPGRPGAAATVAPGAAPAAPRPKVDVFYVHPTTFRSADRWNQDIADATTNQWTDESVIARQGGIFNGCCRVFAPRYRQASSLALDKMAGDGARAFDLAYADVERAFEAYMRRDNHGRPFILAGHSQGAFHIARLLERRIAGTPWQKRMVAAYVIGLNLSEGDFPKTYKTIAICATPEQTGCIVGWNAVLPGDNLAAAAATGERRYVQRYGDDAGKKMVCINPMTFDRGKSAAGIEHSKGAAPGDPGFGPLRALRPNAVGARCENGLLVVDVDPDLGLKPLPGGSMHYHDLGLFYADVRANAILRSAAFLAKPATAGR